MLYELMSFGSQGAVKLLVCTASALVLGVAIALVYMYRGSYTKNFVVTLALLPALVQAVIWVVNGNLGAGVAVMGAFSLVRFRSVAGSSREISSIFFAMAVGLSLGMGYLAFAGLFTVVIGGAMLLYARLPFGGRERTKQLRVTIPEDCEYDALFDDLFARYTKKAELEKVKTTNLGSLFELQYLVELADPTLEKTLLDGIRQRNGNLAVSCGKKLAEREEL